MVLVLVGNEDSLNSLVFEKKLRVINYAVTVHEESCCLRSYDSAVTPSDINAMQRTHANLLVHMQRNFNVIGLVGQYRW